MRAIRLAIAALIGLALAALPITGSLAERPAAQVETRANAPDDACPCCAMPRLRSAGSCNLKCCSAVVTPAGPWAAPRAQTFGDRVAAALAPFSAQPDPPPPRA